MPLHSDWLSEMLDFVPWILLSCLKEFSLASKSILNREGMFNTFKRALQGECTEDWFLLCWRADGLNTSFYPLFFLRMIMIPLKVVWFSQQTCFLHCGIVKQLWGLCSIGTYSQAAMWNCFEALPYFIGLNMY